MSAEDARLAARHAFGGQVEQTKLRHRDARSFRWLDDSWLDFKRGARMLIKYPGLSLVGGIGMAVSIAISAAVFAFFYAYLYATLPIEEGERVVALENWDVKRNNEDRRSLHDFAAWRREMTSIKDLSAYRTIGRNLIVPGGAAEPVRIAEITASAFRLARVPPRLGRPLLEDDERKSAERVVLIGHDVWQSRFASDPEVVGRQVRLGNIAHTIVAAPGTTSALVKCRPARGATESIDRVSGVTYAARTSAAGVASPVSAASVTFLVYHAASASNDVLCSRRRV
jgi:hypothetical protein